MYESSSATEATSESSLPDWVTASGVTAERLVLAASLKARTLLFRLELGLEGVSSVKESSSSNGCSRSRSMEGLKRRTTSDGERRWESSKTFLEIVKGPMSCVPVLGGDTPVATNSDSWGERWTGPGSAGDVLSEVASSR